MLRRTVLPCSGPRGPDSDVAGRHGGSRDARRQHARTDSWTLANGLEVVIRDVPASVGVAITLAYDVGSDQDPPGREGLGALTTEAAFTGRRRRSARAHAGRDGEPPAAGLGDQDHAAADRADRGRLRFQFPGVLHQVANRMRRVTVTDKGLKVASATVKRSLERSWSTRPDVALPDPPPGGRGRHARGDGGTLRHREGPRGHRASRTSSSRITALYVPANAVLSIAGNLGGIDVRRLVEGEFGGIPSGTKSHAATHARLRTGAEPPLPSRPERAVRRARRDRAGARRLAPPVVLSPRAPVRLVRQDPLAAARATVDLALPVRALRRARSRDLLSAGLHRCPRHAPLVRGVRGGAAGNAGRERRSGSVRSHPAWRRLAARGALPLPLLQTMRAASRACC